MIILPGRNIPSRHRTGKQEQLIDWVTKNYPGHEMSEFPPDWNQSKELYINNDNGLCHGPIPIEKIKAEAKRLGIPVHEE